MNQLERNKTILEKYVHPQAALLVSEWIIRFDFKLKIKKERRSKLGDYRAPLKNTNHQITINRNLNPHAFLITLIHEIAHLSCFQKHGHKTKPHGNEWKHEFRILMQPFFTLDIFPQDIAHALRSYLHNPAASSCTDASLYRALKKHDKKEKHIVLLEEIPAMALFIYGEERYFVKGKKIRTRFHCVEYKTKKEYLFSPLAEVKMVSPGLFEE